MALTTRGDGTGPAFLISSSWFNDFKDLLTGTMSDQPVTIANTLSLSTATSLLGIGSLSVSGTPGVEFHSSGGAEAYTSRIQASGGTPGTVGSGTLAVLAAKLLLGTQPVVSTPSQSTPIQLFTGTGTPAGANDGDIWIKG